MYVYVCFLSVKQKKIGAMDTLCVHDPYALRIGITRALEDFSFDLILLYRMYGICQIVFAENCGFIQY